MISAILAGAFLLGAAQQQMDTTFAVRPGGELTIDAMNGSVTVTAWDQPRMRIRSETVRMSDLDIDIAMDGVSVDVEQRGMGHRVALEITVPRSYHVSVNGMNFGVAVTGVTGNVAVDNIEGAITVRAVTGHISVES